MTSAEHSTTVFLLQAIETIPEKASDLISLARGGKCSGDYWAILQRLEALLDTP